MDSPLPGDPKKVSHEDLRENFLDRCAERQLNGKAGLMSCVAGAAARLGNNLIWSNAAGCFWLRVKHIRPVPVTVALDQGFLRGRLPVHNEPPIVLH